MSDADFLAYVGAVSGMLGAFTGIAGAAMGYISYRKTDQLKSLDLRLELMKTGVEVFQTTQEIESLMVDAEKSRAAVAVATGMHGSGGHQRWINQLRADETFIESMDQSLDELASNYASATASELESKIIEMHSLKAMLTGFREKYQAALAADDRERDHLREDARAATISRSQPR